MICKIPEKAEIRRMIQDKAAINTLKILLAWEAGELSEGQAMKALEMSRIEVRQLRQNALEDAQVIFAKLTKQEV